MRGWWLPVLAALVACGDDDNGPGPGTPPEAPTALSSVSLNGAVALTWSDNPFQADPGLFQNYRVYTTSYDIDADPPRCGTAWTLEGTTVAPEFLVGALENGVPRCFSVTAFSVDGAESAKTALASEKPAPEKPAPETKVHQRPSMLRHWRTALPLASAAAIALAWGVAGSQPLARGSATNPSQAGF